MSAGNAIVDHVTDGMKTDRNIGIEGDDTQNSVGMMPQRHQAPYKFKSTLSEDRKWRGKEKAPWQYSRGSIQRKSCNNARNKSAVKRCTNYRPTVTSATVHNNDVRLVRVAAV